MSWLRSLFTFSGRATRKAYWLTLLPLTLVAFTGVGLTIEAEEGDSSIAAASGLVLIVAAMVPMAAVNVRRLHDRNKSGWWLLLYWVIPGLFSSSMGEPAVVPMPHEAMAAVFNLLSVGVSVWALVELGFLKGRPMENRFGPDPLGRGVAETFA